MDAQIVQRLEKNTARLRQESGVLCSSGQSLTVLSRQLRGEHRILTQELAKQYAASRQSRLHRMVGRRLLIGRLPYTSVAVISGAPGAGGSCDACDEPLRAPQLVMTLPMGNTVVRLHADCFMVWNEERRGHDDRARTA